MAWLEPHHGGVLTSQMELQQDQAYTDLTLRLQDGEVRTSRFLLASLSQVFSRMLATDMKERNEGVLTLEHVRKEDWLCILSFYLSGNKLVTADNVEDILVIAHLYELEPLEEHCEKMLVDTLTPENCCDRLARSKTYELSVIPEIYNFIKKKFVSVGESQQFLSLTKEDLLQLLNSGDILTSEKILCKSLLKWLSSNEVDDESSAAIFSHSKLEHLSWEFLCEELLYHNQVVKSTRIRQIVTEEMTKRGGPHGLSNQDDIHAWFPRGKEKYIVVLGHDNENFRALYIYAGGNCWMELPMLQISALFEAHMVEDTIVVTGGAKSQKATHKMLLSTRTWVKGPNLQQGRSLHGMTSVGSSVFVLGGYGNRNPLTSIEKHDMGSNHWEKVGDLQGPNLMQGVAAVGNMIIIAGGLGTLDAIQTFDVVTRTTVLLEARLPCLMAGAHGASLAGGAAFLGHNGDLVQVSLSDNGVAVTSYVRRTDFGDPYFTGLTAADNHLLCFAVESDYIRVDRCTLQGELEDTSNLPQLPVILDLPRTFLTSSRRSDC